MTSPDRRPTRNTADRRAPGSLPRVGAGVPGPSRVALVMVVGVCLVILLACAGGTTPTERTLGHLSHEVVDGGP